MLTFNMFGAFCAEHNIDLAARKSLCESNDPEFAAKAADVVGLYIDPPAKAIVLCVDEKPSIQALERAQGRCLDRPEPRLLSGTAPRPCLQRSKSPAAGLLPSIPSGGAVSSSSAS